MIRFIRVGTCLVVLSLILPCTGRAALSGDGSAANPWIVSGGTYTDRVGTGRTDNDKTLTVQSGGTISAGDKNAVSLGDNATITVGGTIENNAYRNNGLFSTGGNTVEVGSFSNITVENGGLIHSTGTQGQSEAINVHGYGNTITINQGGVVKADHNAAIWFQDQATSKTQKNVVDNSGLIERVGGGAVMGAQGGNNAGGIIFYNRTTGRVVGDLLFASGDDELYLEASGSGVSSVTGRIDGGAGNNTLTLTGSGDDFLAGALSHFQTMRKQGSGTWDVTGNLIGFNNVYADNGILRLSGDNAGFTGNLYITQNVEGAGTYGNVEARAQSLPQGTIYNDGLLTITNAAGDDAVYTGNIVSNVTTHAGDLGAVVKTGGGLVILNPSSGANSYHTGTIIREGGIGAYNIAALGEASSAIALGDLITGSKGALYMLGDMDLSAKIVTVYNGEIWTDPGVTGTISSPMSVIGPFAKSGSGSLVINSEINSLRNYTVGNDLTVSGGSLILNGWYNNPFGATRVYGATLEINNATAANTTTSVDVDGGILRLNNNATLQSSGNAVLTNNSLLEGWGTLDVATSMTNAGTIRAGSDADPYKTLTARGQYHSQAGAQVVAVSKLGDDTSPHNMFVIDGDYAGAPTDVRVVNLNGAGAKTDQGIPVIRVTGASTADDFRLVYDYKHSDGTVTVIGGTTVYTFDSVLEGTERVFRLHTLVDTKGNPVVNPAIPVYEAYPLVLARFNHLNTLQQRVGNRTWLTPAQQAEDASLAASPRRDIERAGVWLRAEGSSGTYNQDRSTVDTKFDMDMGRLQLGVDTPLHTWSDGSVLVGGLSGYYGLGKAKIRAGAGDGEINTDAFGFGGGLTWYAQSGLYVDAQAQISWFKSDLEADEIVSSKMQKRNNRGWGYSFGLETGYDIPLNENWTLTPQAQIVYSEVDFDSFTDAHNVRVSLKNADSLEGRLGIAANYENTFTADAGDERRVKLYVIPNVYNEFREKAKLSIADTTFKTGGDRVWGGIGLGGSFDWGDSAYSIYGEIGRRASLEHFDSSRDIYGDIGFRIAF